MNPIPENNNKGEIENQGLSMAMSLIEQYNTAPAKADEIFLSRFLVCTDKNRQYWRACQFIFLTVLRNKPLIEKAIKSHCKKFPKGKLRAILECVSAQLVEASPDECPKIIDDGVETAKSFLSAPEVGFCNAVLRKNLKFIKDFKNSAETFEDKTMLLGHPLWLAKRWSDAFGEGVALEIMQKNQEPSPVFFRKAFGAQADAEFAKRAEFFAPAEFEDFYIMKGGSFGEVEYLAKNKLAYIQDPSTSYAPKLLNPLCGETVLDLCAAPGGKSRFILDLLKKSAASSGGDISKSVLVSVDQGGKRFKMLLENLEGETSARALACDLFKEDLAQKLAAQNLPQTFDAVLLDAPCSNSGVVGRRPDVRMRIRPQDIAACAKIQLGLLDAAKKFVKAGGRLVYSTCSIDEEENGAVIKKFLAENPDFTLEKGGINLPLAHSDGSGAFLLKKLS